MTREQPQQVVLDWGTSSFRALLVSPAGAVLDRVETGDGISTLARDAFAGVLSAALQPWRARFGALDVIAAGMIGSRNGWLEMPYAPCPAGVQELAALTRRVIIEPGLTITFLPGLNDPAAQPFPDVMRGEEAQLAGLGLDQDRIVILPGTHSKWAQISGDAIRRFQTFVTGEIFGTLARHSFIAKAAQPPATPDWAAFSRGLAIARSAALTGAGLSSTLFSVRTGWLAGQVQPSEMQDMLSGLIVGGEFVEAFRLGWAKAGDAVTLLGDDDLMAVYQRAAADFGLAATIAPPDCAVRGALLIARAVTPQG